MAKTAYSPAGSPTRTPRSTEYDLFAQITRRLAKAAKTPKDVPALASALHDNRSLWIELAADAAGEGNGLPVQLRAGILGLAEFTRQHTSAVLASRGDAAVLIEVNTAVMRGLHGEGKE